MSRTGASTETESRLQTRSGRGLGVGGGGVTADGSGVSFWGDEHVLELDRGGDYTTL